MSTPEQPTPTVGDRVMDMWVVYSNPSDYPGKWVLRRWEIQRGNTDPIPTKNVHTGDLYAEVIAHLPGGLTRLGRDQSDDPTITESWV